MAAYKLRVAGFLGLFASFALSASALTVSVAPGEGKDYAPPPDGSGSPLGFLVSGCMDVLFDSGWIVTDSDTFRGPRESWSPGIYAMSEAKEGQVDYLVALYVDWSASTYHKGTLLPAAVSYRVVRVSDGKTIISGEEKGVSDSEETAAHFAEAASGVGARVARACAKPLSTLAMGGEL